MKLDKPSLATRVAGMLPRLKGGKDRPDTKEARLAAARAIDEALARAYGAMQPTLARDLLLGLDVPMRTHLLSDEPYVFISLIKPFTPGDGFPRRPEHFRAVDETQFRPGVTHAENDAESSRVTKCLQEFIREVHRSPELLFEELPGFCYKITLRGAPRSEERQWPGMNVLEYALLERNTIIAGIMAAELAGLARSPAYGERAVQLLRVCVAVAIDIEDGPYASMLLMGLAAAQPKSWLEQRISAAVTSVHPVAATLTYYQQFAGQLLGLDNMAWKAHWLHHDPCVRDFIYTCTVDTLLYATDARLTEACGLEPIHRNHFMHGNMVLAELEARMAQATRLISSDPVNRAAREAALAHASRVVEIMRLDASSYGLKDKVALLNARLDDTELKAV